MFWPRTPQTPEQGPFGNKEYCDGSPEQPGVKTGGGVGSHNNNMLTVPASPWHSSPTSCEHITMPEEPRSILAAPPQPATSLSASPPAYPHAKVPYKTDVRSIFSGPLYLIEPLLVTQAASFQPEASDPQCPMAPLMPRVCGCGGEGTIKGLRTQRPRAAKAPGLTGHLWGSHVPIFFSEDHRIWTDNLRETFGSKSLELGELHSLMQQFRTEGCSVKGAPAPRARARNQSP